MSEPTWSSISLTRGVDEDVRLAVTDKFGVAYDLTGAKVWFAVKSDLDDDDTQALILINSTDDAAQFDLGELDEGIVDLTLTPTQMDLLSQGTQYKFAWKVLLLSGKLKAPARGDISVVESGIEAIA